MTTNKMTYTTALNAAISALSTNADYSEVCEKLTSLCETVAKRNARKATGERKPTKKQVENEAFKVRILEALTSPMSASDVAAMFDVSVQKVSPLLNRLLADNLVTKTDAKGKAKATFVAVSANA